VPQRAARLLFCGLLGGVAALAALATLAIIVIGTFSNSTLRQAADHQGPWQSEPYVWEGGGIILAPTSTRRPRNPHCVITPEQGEEIEVQLLSKSSPLVGEAYINRRYWNRVELQPWFEGSATIVCSGPVQVWTGFGYSVERIKTDRLFPWAAAGAIALPLVGAVLLWRGSRSKVG